MPGDFSRNTFDERKQFTSVRMQQGRVQLDADWNEQMDIIEHRIRVGSEDFIGGSGVPSGNPGYKITVAKNDFTISKGRFYLQGILLNNEQDFSYSAQTLPEKDTLAKQTSTGLYVVYLDVWAQSVSSAEDSSFLEPALAGADTSIRIKNRTQIKLAKLAKDPGGSDLKCETVIDNTPDNKTVWQTVTNAGTGKLNAKVTSNANLNNQLYRIEIHDAGDQSKMTFKWSRNNAALIGKIKAISGNDIILNELSNQVLNFTAGQWVELSTEKLLMQNKPGVFILLQKVVGNQLTVMNWPTGIKTSDFMGGTVRQWDKQAGMLSNDMVVDSTKNNRIGNDIVLTIKTGSDLLKNVTKGNFIQLTNQTLINANKEDYFVKVKSVSVSTITVSGLSSISDTVLKSLDRILIVNNAISSASGNNLINIENGLQIQFSKGTYKTGDYWLLPTRAAVNNIASIQYGEFSKAQLPEGIKHYYASLALVRKKADNTWELAGDCRNIISALGNKAYQSDSNAPANSVFVDKDGDVTIKEGFNVSKQTKTKSLQVATGTPVNMTSLLANQWLSTLKKIPTARSAATGVALNRKIYVLGGTDVTNKTLKDVQVYDPVENSWTQLQQSLPQAVSHAASVVVNGKIYLFCGKNGTNYLNTLYEYDSTKKSWNSKIPTPSLTVRANLSAVAFNGRVYLIGGESSTENLNLVEEYDPINNTVVKKANMPTKRYSMTANLVNGKIYVMGGYQNGKKPQPTLNVIETYDPIADSWTTETDTMTIGRRSAASVVLNGKIYLIGGHDVSTVRSTVQEYDPTRAQGKKWISKSSMSINRQSLVAAVVNGVIYAIGGWKYVHDSHPDNKATDLVESYIPNPILNIDNSLKMTGALQIGDDSTLVNTITSNLSQYRDHAIPTEKAVQEKLAVMQQNLQVNKLEAISRINQKANEVVASKIWKQTQKLQAKDKQATDRFGYSVAISGNYAIVGAYLEDTGGSNAGSAYIFEWKNNTWVEQQKLQAKDKQASEHFGYSVAISGNYAIVGAYLEDTDGTDVGSAYIFELKNNTWTEQQKLQASDKQKDDWFGYSVAISGHYAIVGAHLEDTGGTDVGSAYIFELKNNTWVEQQKLQASDKQADDHFGWSVAINGDHAIVGAYREDTGGTDAGSAYIFHRDGSTWKQQQKLQASDKERDDWFGYSVAISGNYAIVGARLEDTGGTDAGSAYIFHWDGSTWKQQQKLQASDKQLGDYFGGAVSISGNYAIVGAAFEDTGGGNAGSAYIFYRDGSTWKQQQKLQASDKQTIDHFGSAVSISGNRAIVSAPWEDTGATDAGSAYIWTLQSAGDATIYTRNTGSGSGIQVDANVGNALSVQNNSAKNSTIQAENLVRAVR